MNKGNIKDRVSIFANIGTAQEVIVELTDSLRREYKEFSTDSMNEGALYLQGQKDMLEDIIEILEREIVYIYNRDCPALGKKKDDYYTNEFTGSIRELVKSGLIGPRI